MLFCKLLRSKPQGSTHFDLVFETWFHLIKDSLTVTLTLYTSLTTLLCYGGGGEGVDFCVFVFYFGKIEFFLIFMLCFVLLSLIVNMIKNETKQNPLHYLDAMLHSNLLNQ